MAGPAQGGSIEVGAPPEGLLALLLAHWPEGAPGRTLLHVARSETRAERLARAARSLAAGCEVLLLPPWDCLPYDRASPSRPVMGRRVGVLSRLIEPAPAGGRLVIATIESLLQRVPPRTVWPEIRCEIRPGQATADLQVWLIRAGYVLDERVDEPGEAAIWGEVIDLFPADGEGPFRLEVAAGRIGRIRRYDPLDQRSTGEAEGVQVGPASEAILAEAAAREFMGAREEAPASDFLVGPAATPRRASGLSSTACHCATSGSRRCSTICRMPPCRSIPRSTSGGQRGWPRSPMGSLPVRRSSGTAAPPARSSLRRLNRASSISTRPNGTTGWRGAPP